LVAIGSVVTARIATTLAATLTAIVTAPLPAIVATRPPSFTAALVARSARRPRLDDRLEVAASHDLDPFAVLGALSAADHTDDVDPVETLFDLDAQHRPDRGAIWQHRPVNDTTGVLGPGSTPGPRTVALRAGQLDLDPSGHGRELYRFVTTNVTAPS
jgi:hypothetical protein